MVIDWRNTIYCSFKHPIPQYIVHIIQFGKTCIYPNALLYYRCRKRQGNDRGRKPIDGASQHPTLRQGKIVLWKLYMMFTHWQKRQLYVYGQVYAGLWMYPRLIRCKSGFIRWLYNRLHWKNTYAPIGLRRVKSVSFRTTGNPIERDLARVSLNVMRYLPL